ncbi:MAG: ribose 5-phosphate isomerase A [Bdellovibrionales bacterium]|nr:ribose 5-phosphate isomerase A [Bdellovibrionales bacterium]
MGPKDYLAAELSSRLSNNQSIGVGTGTTVEAVLGAIKKRIVEESLEIRLVPTSYQSAWRLEELGLPVTSPATALALDWAFDGADEVDPDLRLLKGRGAALLHEKLIAARARELYIVADESKLVGRLGEKMAVPVEVIPEARYSVEESLAGLGASEVSLRWCESLERKMPLFTQEGNLILDAKFLPIASDLESKINSIPGVVENGIFTNHATEVLIGKDDGVEVRKR